MDFKAKIISPLEKVFYDDKIEKLVEYKKSSALIGEKHNFCIAYKDDDYAEIHYSVRSFYFKIKSDIKKHIKTYTVEHVPAVYAAPIYKEKDGFLREYPGLFPDLLQPVKEKSEVYIVEKLLNTLWIEVDTANVAAGRHAITVEFYSMDGNLMSTCTHDLKVINAVLPKNDMVMTQWFHTDCIADYYNIKVFSEKHWKAIENYMRVYADGGNTMIYTPLFTPPLDTKVGGERTTTQLIDVTVQNGKYSFGFDKFYRWVKLAQKCGIKYFEMSHLFTQWGAFHAPKIVAKVDGKTKKIFGWQTDSHGKEYEAFLAAFLEKLQEELKKLGINDKTYFHISDEPSPEHLESYTACSKIMRKYLKGYKIMDAMHDILFYNNGLLDIPIPSLQNSTPFIEKNIDPRFVYYCGVPRNVTGRGIGMNSARNRIIGTLFYAHEVKGFLHWGYNFYNACRSVRKVDPYFITDADKRFCAGDSFLVYPADKFTSHISVRYAVFRDGIQDMCALKLCEAVCGRDAVIQVINSLNGGKAIDLLTVPCDTAFTLKLREKINSMIEKALK